MTKKRIADLLKEEVEKSNQTEEVSEENTAQQAQKNSAKSAPSQTAEGAPEGTARTRKRTNKPSASAKKAVAASDTTALEKQLAELQTALSKAQKQITGLQEDMETQQARVFELKDELAASQKETADRSEELSKVSEELETAKETIRKLTSAQVNDDASETEQPPKQIVHGADLATNRNTLSLRNRPRSYKSIPEYAIQRGEHNSMLSDDDIGWVD